LPLSFLNETEAFAFIHLYKVESFVYDFFLPVFIKKANIPPNQKYYGCAVVIKVSRPV